MGKESQNLEHLQNTDFTQRDNRYDTIGKEKFLRNRK